MAHQKNESSKERLEITMTHSGSCVVLSDLLLGASETSHDERRHDARPVLAVRTVDHGWQILRLGEKLQGWKKA
jgi:hypothetical protein